MLLYLISLHFVVLDSITSRRRHGLVISPCMAKGPDQNNVGLSLWLVGIHSKLSAMQSSTSFFSIAENCYNQFQSHTGIINCRVAVHSKTLSYCFETKMHYSWLNNNIANFFYAKKMIVLWKLGWISWIARPSYTCQMFVCLKMLILI